MYELGRLSAADYKAKSAELDGQKMNLGAERAEPVFVRQRTTLATLVDDWDDMTSEERRHLIGTVFVEVYADKDGISKMLPREDWNPYMAAVLRTPAALERWGTERKTGVKRAEVKQLGSFRTSADGSSWRVESTGPADLQIEGREKSGSQTYK
jgi:hypothetical protein